MLIHSWQPDVRRSGPQPGTDGPVDTEKKISRCVFTQHEEGGGGHSQVVT